MQRGTEEIKLDADVKKKSTVQEIRKDADVEEFKQADHMLLILREMMVMMKLMLVGGAKPYCVGLQCAMRCETFEMVMSGLQSLVHLSSEIDYGDANKMKIFTD
uniref:Uncharacterized protein n=1 Tax=Oryza sativa subsp. japonica TaxID=39947 RepID=Q8H4V8_ORYSJ|nr:hypothetical protein [Oryza sativa Japonica Group]